MSNKILIIGIGNEFRGDDAAGLIVAEKIRDKKNDNIVVRFCTRDGSALLMLWEGYDNVVLIDAVSSGAPTGTIHEIDLNATDLKEESFRTSGHSFSIFETVKLAGYVDKVPSVLKLYGIEGVAFAMGDEMSEDVTKNVDVLVERIYEYITMESGNKNVHISIP